MCDVVESGTREKYDCTICGYKGSSTRERFSIRRLIAYVSLRLYCKFSRFKEHGGGVSRSVAVAHSSNRAKMGMVIVETPKGETAFKGRVPANREKREEVEGGISVIN